MHIGGGEAERASALRARLPRPLPAGASSVVPAGVALEVRRLRSCVLSSPEARRLYALTEADLKALPGAAEVMMSLPPFQRRCHALLRHRPCCACLRMPRCLSPRDS